jgi:hypothetical protein
MSNLFEEPEEIKVIDEEETFPLLEDIEDIEDIEPPKKVKKPRKPLSDARKAQLREQLKKGREASLLKRSAKKNVKVMDKIKKEEAKVEVSVKKKIMSEMEKEQELEERLTIKIRNKIKKEQEDERKDNELKSLRQQVEELKKKRVPATIKEEPSGGEEEPTGKVLRRSIRVASKPIDIPKYNKFSPHNHFMGNRFY